MKLTGAFVSKFLENWNHANDMAGRRMSWGDEHRVVERFMEAMKYEMAAAILSEAIPNAKFSAPAQPANPLDPA